MKKIFVTVVVVFTLTVLFLRFCWGNRKKVQDYSRMTMQEATEYMKTHDNYVLLDVRTVEEYEAGHIPGAICIPNETIGSERPSAIHDLNQCILVYCRSGSRSRQAADKLCDIGYQNIIEIGGILDWKGEIER